MKQIILVLTLVLGVSCTPTPAKMVSFASFEEIDRDPTETVDVYTYGDNVPYHFKEIGIITVEGQIPISTMIKYFKIKAKEIGANGVILRGHESEVAGLTNIKGTSIVLTKRESQAIAIVYLRRK